MWVDDLSKGKAIIAIPLPCANGKRRTVYERETIVSPIICGVTDFICVCSVYECLGVFSISGNAVFCPSFIDSSEKTNQVTITLTKTELEYLECVLVSEKEIAEDSEPIHTTKADLEEKRAENAEVVSVVNKLLLKINPHAYPGI